MINELKSYPEYKESGFLWLGRVPSHWAVRRIKTVLRELNCRSMDGEGVLLSLTRARGLVPHSDRTNKVHSARTLVGYKRYEPGQIVMNRMQAWSGMFGAGAANGLVSPDYAVFEIIGGEDPKFLLERLKAPDLVEQFALQSKGIGSGFNRLYTEKFGAIAVAMPPHGDQALIARFLNWANGRMERAIRAKRKVIGLLHEQKQVIVQRAVTRGLNPSAPLRSSGIPSLGDIPQHWELLPLKRVLRKLIDCEHKTAPQVEGTAFRVVRTTGVRGGALSLHGTYCTTEDGFRSWTRRGVPQPGDVIFTREAPAGEACLVPEGMQVCLGQRTVLMKPMRRRLNSQFLVHMLYCPPPRVSITLATQGSTVGHFNMSDIGALPILLPPLDEQSSIVQRVAEETSGLQLAISRLDRETNLLREYHTRLVADVVTGKLDVREAALDLTSEAPPERANDDADATAELDEVDVVAAL